MEKADVHSTIYQLSASQGILGLQMLFVAFGALVLVPLLTGLDPNVALCTAGLGTLAFQMVTRGRVPIFLASSFAFIAPIMYGVKTWGIAGTMCGLFAVGIVYIILGVIIKLKGSGFLHKLLPPVVTGPVIMVIGIILMPVGYYMAMGKTGDGAIELFPQWKSLIVSGVTLLTAVLISIRAKGIFKLIPILIAIIVGYIVALFFGMVDFSGVMSASWVVMPNFTLPEWNSQAIWYMIPIAIAPAIEHFGDVVAIKGVTGEDYFEDPGIHRTISGDGIATSIAAFLGGPPNTTYSEVTGAVTLTKAFNPAIMTWAAIFAVLLSFVGKLGALLQSVPVPVMGGVMMLLFGVIASVGAGSLKDVDFKDPRNMVIFALIIGAGIAKDFSLLSLDGIGLAGVVGVLLNLFLPKTREEEIDFLDQKV